MDTVVPWPAKIGGTVAEVKIPYHLKLRVSVALREDKRPSLLLFVRDRGSVRKVSARLLRDRAKNWSGGF